VRTIIHQEAFKNPHKSNLKRQWSYEAMKSSIQFAVWPQCFKHLYCKLVVNLNSCFQTDYNILLLIDHKHWFLARIHQHQSSVGNLLKHHTSYHNPNMNTGCGLLLDVLQHIFKSLKTSVVLSWDTS